MEKRTQSDPPSKEVPDDDQSISQEEVFCKMETTEFEIIPDFISFATESMESAKPTKVVNTTETATHSNLTRKPMNPLEHVISEVVNSLILPHALEKLYRACDSLKSVPEPVLTEEKPEFVDQSKLEVCETAVHPAAAYVGQDEISANVLEDSKSAISSDSQNSTRNGSFIERQSLNYEVENLKDVAMNFTKIREDSLIHTDQACVNLTMKLSDTDVKLQSSVITIEDSFEERSCNQLENTEESLKSEKVIVSSKTNNLITQHVVEPIESIEEHNTSNSVMIVSPNKKFIDDSLIAHTVPVDDSEAKTDSQDSFVVNTNESLEDNDNETYKIDLGPQCSKSEETSNMEPNVEKTEVNTNNEIIIIDDSLTENSVIDCMDSVADIDKTSPAISVESSEAEQDEISEDEKIQPITRKSANVNETFVTCTPSLVADASLEYTNFEAAITKQISFDLGDMESADSVEPGSTEDTKTRSPEALNSTENCLVAALEALNINGDDKDDTFLSCQEDFDLSSIERNFSLKGTKTVDESETSIEITKTVFCKSNEYNTEEAPVSETVQFPKSNIEQDSTGSDSNSSCETVILKEKKSDFSMEVADVSLTKSETPCSQTSQTTNSRINNEVSFEKVSETLHTSDSTMEQIIMESTRKTSHNELIVEDDTKDKMPKTEDVGTIKAIKFVPPNSPQASCSLVLKNEADVEEAPIIVSSESLVKQAPITTETIKNASCCEVPLEDNKMDISTGPDEVLTFIPSTSPQANISVMLKNEADTEEASNICSPESFAKQETVKSTKDTSCQTITLEEGSQTIILSPEPNIEQVITERTRDVFLAEVDPSKNPQANNSSISKTEVTVEETAKTVVESPESTVKGDYIQTTKDTSCGNTSLEHSRPDLRAEADVWSKKCDQSNGPQVNSSLTEVNTGETSKMMDSSQEYNIEQRSPMTGVLEDNEMDLPAKMDETNDKVSSIKNNLSNTPQGDNIMSEGSDEGTPKIVEDTESNNGQNTVVAIKDTFDETVTYDNKSNLSTENDDGSPAKSFVSGDVSVSSCDTPERSLLSYSSLMEASPSIFAEEAARYEKQSHLKLRINELEQSLAKLKLQLRQKEAVIMNMNLQMEKIRTVKQEEKTHKAAVLADDIITIKKLRMYEEKLQEAKLKIAELEKLEDEKSLLETKLKVLEEEYSELEKKFEETKLQLKTYEQKNFNMIFEVERAEREKKKVLETLQEYDALLLRFTADKNNLKGCLEDVMLKYERAKALILGFKNNENAYKKENDDLRDKLKTFAEQYENFKLQAMAEIDAANKENFNLREQLYQEKERKVKKPVGKK